MTSAEIVIVGAGPAGVAAAVRASESGKQVTLIDDNPSEGGQIWRGGKSHPSDPQAATWFRELERSGASVVSGSRVIGGDPRKRFVHVETNVETARSAFEISYDQLILATGAREFFLPFPGWTLPNVMGVGGLQALVKSGLPVEGKRIVVAGSGPLLLAVAEYLRTRGAIVPAIAEQAAFAQVARFAMHLFGHPNKLRQAIALRARLGSTPYLTGSWVVSALGNERLASVQLRAESGARTIECDYLAIAYGFVPNTELAQFFGCSLQDRFVSVDEFQRTSLEGILCAGEVTGLGGVDLSLVEGEIAGYAAAGREDLARSLFPARERARQFARHLNQAFSVREEIRRLPDAATIICRCEDVAFQRLQTAGSWRSAKLHLRCGMGPCQGRVCGPAVEFLFGWKPESVRPPVFPARVASLILEGNSK